MRRILPILFTLLSLAGAARAQNPAAAKRIAYNTTLPATCEPSTGDVYIKIGVTPTEQYYCSATNTWTKLATKTELDAHAADTSNPHAVTKGQVGLGSVTNDAQLKIASNLSDLASAATARTNLGLGTAAVKNAPASGNAASGEVALGSDTRLTDARSPTSHASTHAAAGSDPITISGSQVTNLVSDLAARQPLDAELTALAGLTSAADKVPYFTGSGAAALTDFTAFGRSLIDDASAAAARTTLGLGTAATAAAPAGAIVGTTDTQTLTNKTVSGASNTLTNISNSSLSNSSVTVGSTSVSLGGTAATVAGLTLTTPTVSSFVNAAHSHQDAAGGGALDAAAISSGTLGLARLPSVPRARAYATGNQSIPNATYTALLFDAEQYDTDGIHSTVSNTDRLTCTTGGTYHVTANVHFDASTAGSRIAAIVHNGSTFVQRQVLPPATTVAFGTQFVISADYECSAGDYFQLQVYQNIGAALNSLASFGGASMSMFLVK